VGGSGWLSNTGGAGGSGGSGGTGGANGGRGGGGPGGICNPIGYGQAGNSGPQISGAFYGGGGGGGMGADTSNGGVAFNGAAGGSGGGGRGANYKKEVVTFNTIDGASRGEDGAVNTGGGGGAGSACNARGAMYLGYDGYSQRTAGGRGADGRVVISYTTLTTPGAPTGLVVTPQTTSADLSWTAPANLGGGIGDYLIEFQIKGGSWTTFNDSVSASTSVSVTGLTANEIYSFRVSAMNQAGTGPASVIRGSLIVPGVIAFLDGSNSSSYAGSGTTWTDLTGRSNDATAFNTPTFSNSDKSFTLNGTNQYFSFTDSTKFNFSGTQAYSINVLFSPSRVVGNQQLVGRRNGNVAGSWQVAVVGDKLQGVREVSPWNITGTTSLVVGEKYLATYVYDGTNLILYLNGKEEARGAIGSIQAQNIVTLIGAQQYQGNPVDFFGGNVFSVTIANAAHTAAQVQGIYNAFDLAPGLPTIGVATATGTTSATVAFTAPVSNGGAVITSYTATSTPGNITGTLSQAISGTITVSGLSPGTAYTFKVTATNSLGTSASSAASNSITTTVGAALTPTFGTPTATADGYTVQISNFNADYTWAGTATASGVVQISNTGLVTVSNVASSVISTTTITTTRTGYTSGSATVSGNTTCAPAVSTYTTASGVLYNVRQFLNTGTCLWTVPASVTALNYLVVGGGGGGGKGQDSGHGGGGGGAGGYRTNVTGETSGGGSSAESAFSVTPLSVQSIVVGAGGAGQTISSSAAGSGSSSSLGSITALGGGRGANYFNFCSTTGGSGGGGAVSRISSCGTANQELLLLLMQVLQQLLQFLQLVEQLLEMFQ
jgi:hypothetical protein